MERQSYICQRDGPKKARELLEEGISCRVYRPWLLLSGKREVVYRQIQERKREVLKELGIGEKFEFTKLY